MFLSKFHIINGISNSQDILSQIIHEWEQKYIVALESLCEEYNINVKTSVSSNDNINNHDAYTLIKEAVKCKAYIDVELRAVEDIRGELEDCHMVKELEDSLKRLGEEKHLQEEEINKLTEKNQKLKHEKEKLEKSLHDINSQTSIHVNEETSRKIIFAQKLENLRIRSQSIKNMNQNTDYCRIVPHMSIISDSEHSVSEEDSLEKDKKKELFSDSPIQFNSGLSAASKSTPIKGINNNNSNPQEIISSSTKHVSSETHGNLTQDLKDIQTYLNNTYEEAFLNHTSIIDWDMSQPFFDDSKERVNDCEVVQGMECYNKDQIRPCDSHDEQENIELIFNSNILNAPKKFIQQSENDINILRLKLKEEKEKYEALISPIAKLYGTINGATDKHVKQSLTCSGDKPDEDDILPDPINQILLMQKFLDTKDCNEEEDIINEVLTVKNKSNEVEYDKDSLNIFKSLSEVSVRLLTEIVNNLHNINIMLTQNEHETSLSDNTSLVMDYLQYLISLKNVDFSNDDAKNHPIYDFIKDFEKNIQKLLDKVSIIEKDKGGLSESLESFYQEQLNNCYEDISKLKRQLDCSQKFLTNNIPADTVEVLFEAKLKLQEELDGVDREYSRQMIQERKRLEESEVQYNSLLTNYENIQKKYSEDVTSLKLSIDHLQRQHEDDKRFIEQQHSEWDLERSQHTADIENLNKTIGRIKRSSSCSESLSDCIESPIKIKLKKSNSLPKSKYQVKQDYSNDEVIFQNNSTQTINDNIMVLIGDISFNDLENYEEFKSLLIEVKENHSILLSVIHELSDVFFDVIEDEGLAIHLPHLLDLSEKNIKNLPRYSDNFWDNAKSEIFKLKEFLLKFMREGRIIMLDYDRVQEELDTSLINSAVKQGQINALEDEVQNLMEFQKNLSKDYELVQSMLEEKQMALDACSANMLSENITDEVEDTIMKLRKELIEKQNIINERDEDLYVVKEEKENIDQERLLIQKHYDDNIKYQEMYHDLENELLIYQRNNNELHEQINDLIKQLEEQGKAINDKNNLEVSLTNCVIDLTQDNELMKQRIISITDENNLSALRLIELEHQFKHNLEKLTKNLEETEQKNLEIMNAGTNKTENSCNIYCQTEIVLNEISFNECHDCTNIQKALLTTMEKLKNEFRLEKDKRDQIETKHRQFLNQYDALSNKVFCLEASVRDPKFLSIDNDYMNESMESFDRNTFLHASQISLQSFEEDIEDNPLIKLETEISLKKDKSEDKSEECQAVLDTFVIKNSMNFPINNDCGTNISEWLADLLNEVENVLQSCIIGDDISAEVLAKVSKFRQLLEQMYKKQISVLLDKIYAMERDLQIERKNNLELNNKANFLMTEVQESESVHKNLKIRFDLILSENNRLTEGTRILSDQARSARLDLTDQINKLKDELDSEKYKNNDISRQLKSEQRRCDQLESALSVANERTQLVEQSNSEMIKKSRQQMDYQQKEIDSLNAEYADMFRRCNENKLQLETLQQNLRFQISETENAKHELRETIQSNTEYRTKMNEFIKMYQEKRSKLEVEAKELHQLLQISCRREITFIKENENLRMKYQSSQHLNKEYEHKIKELENCINDLHQRHEEDRYEWLKIINGPVDKKKDESVLSQVNWLLRMLQLRIELLSLHYSSTANYDSISVSRNNFENLSNNNNNELVMLLSSIKSMQSMIGVYLNNNPDMPTLSCGHSTDNKIQYFGKFERQQNSLSKRPKPTGSSDSLDSISDTESSFDQQNQKDIPRDMKLMDTKIYVLQMNKIIELQVALKRSEKWKLSLLFQKKFILSQIPSKLRTIIEKPLLTEQQKSSIKNNFFKCKFKVITFVIIAIQRLSKSINPIYDNIEKKDNFGRMTFNVPFPMFSTLNDNKRNDTIIFKEHNNIILSKIPIGHQSSKSIITNNIVQSNGKKTKCSDDIQTSRYSSDGLNNHSTKNQAILTPVHCISPILEKPLKSHSSNVNPVSCKNFVTAAKQGLSNSYSYPLRSSMKSASNQYNCVSSLDRNIIGKTVKLSNTIKQIDDFGKRLDKYTEKVSD